MAVSDKHTSLQNCSNHNCCKDFYVLKVEVTRTDKRTSLRYYRNNYYCKNIYITGPRLNENVNFFSEKSWKRMFNSSVTVPVKNDSGLVKQNSLLL